MEIDNSARDLGVQPSDNGVSGEIPVNAENNIDKPSRFPVKLVMIITILVIAIAGLGYAGYKVWYPQFVVRQFVSNHLETLRIKDYSSAYTQTTAGFKELNTQGDYQRFADVQGLSSGDIPYKITEARPFVNERNLTDHAEVLFELKGDTGQIQLVRVMLVKELGDYKIRLIELPGEVNRSSWIGFRYDYEQLPGSEGRLELVDEEVEVPIQEADSVPIVEMSRPATVDTDVRLREWKNVDSLAQQNVSTWLIVTKPEIKTSAQVAAEQHFGYVRFADVTSLQNAISQLHPVFKEIETSQTYLDWMEKVGITNIKDYSVTTGAVEVRQIGSTAVAKVEFLMKDFRTSDGSTIPEEKRIYIGLLGELDSNQSIRWQDWKVISLFTDEFITAYPGFFPF